MPRPGTISGTDTQEPADLLHLALPTSQKVVLVIDLVESVRLMSADEAGTVARWHDFVHHAQTQAILAHQGRLVKSLGDGLMVEFEQARDAVNAAQSLHLALSRTNAGLSAERQMHLRAGINSSQIYTDQLDIYGAGVNLAARLATLAGPGETVVSSSVRDGLTDGLDASIEDLGECYLKHLEAPVRAYRVGPAGTAPAVAALIDYRAQLQPTIAVIPFESRSREQEHFAIGEIIADGVIAQLSRTPGLRLISRLSTTRFRGRASTTQEIEKHLAANFALTGSYLLLGTQLVVSAELVNLGNDELVWTDRITSSLADLLAQDCKLSHQLAVAIQGEILSTELQRVRQYPLPTLASYSLMLAGVALMHQSTRSDFIRSREALDHLLERHSRSPDARAWLAKWHVLKTTRGMTHDIESEGRQALEQTRRALDVDPHNSLALAMEGFVYCHLKKDLGAARDRLNQASEINPNEALAWLFQSVVHAFAGDTASALQASEHALALSPLDPLRYYYESLAASSALSAGHYERAVALCESSLRRNRTHTSTLRALITALIATGQEIRARKVASDLMRLTPEFTVASYRSQSASASYPFGQQVAQALLAAGIPLS